MRSNIRPAEEYTAAAYGGGWVPRALPRIYLVGTMRAIAPGGADFLPKGRKTRGLLACLCLTQGERISRNRLIGLLWDRSAEAQARMSLRQSLSELNSIVNRHVPGLVEIGRDSIQLDVRKCWVDALAIIEVSTDVTVDTSNLVQPYSERLLEDLDGITPSFDQWLAAERTSFEDRVRKILEAELDRLTEQHAKPEMRAAAARRLVNFEPTHEGAVRSLMKAFAQMGDRPQAIREFERCRQALRPCSTCLLQKRPPPFTRQYGSNRPKWRLHDDLRGAVEGTSLARWRGLAPPSRASGSMGDQGTASPPLLQHRRSRRASPGTDPRLQFCLFAISPAIRRIILLPRGWPRILSKHCRVFRIFL